MARQLLPLLASLLLCLSAQAQGSYVLTFGGTGLDYANHATTAPGDHIMLTGPTQSGGFGGNDIYLMKLNINGGIAWQRSYGNTGNDMTQSIVATSDGGFVLAGSTTGATSTFDFFTVKVSSTGALLWSAVSGTNTQVEQGQTAIQTSDGGILVSGRTTSDLTDIFLVKYAANGAPLWSRVISGPRHETAYSLLQAPDGGILIAGSSSVVQGTDDDMLLVKTDANGNFQWAFTYGGTGQEIMFDITLASDGFLYATGFSNSFGANRQFMLMRLSTAGALQYARAIGGAQDDWGGYAIRQTSDGGLALSGYTTTYGAGQQDYLLVKTDLAGAVQWARAYGGTVGDYGYELLEPSPGQYLIYGNTQSFGAGNWDALLVKTGTNGAVGCISSNANPGSSVQSPTQTAVTLSSPIFGNHFSYTTQAGTSTLARGVQCIVLPLRFEGMAADLMERGGTRLRWLMEDAHGVSAIVVQREAAGGEWTAIGTLPPDVGDAGEGWEFVDPDGAAGMAYRVAALDADGAWVHSPVMIARGAAAAGLSVWPQPAGQFADLRVAGADGGQWQLLDMQGHPLAEGAWASGERIRMPLESVPAGCHVLVVRAAQHVQRTKLSIARQQGSAWSSAWGRDVPR